MSVYPVRYPVPLVVMFASRFTLHCVPINILLLSCGTDVVVVVCVCVVCVAFGLYRDFGEEMNGVGE